MLIMDSSIKMFYAYKDNDIDLVSVVFETQSLTVLITAGAEGYCPCDTHLGFLV